MKVALVHDYLREYGGAERVVEVLHSIWPEAPLYTSFVDWQALGKHAKRFDGWDIKTSWVQQNWLVKKYHSPLRFLAPKVWESFDLSGFDVVISSSGWFMCRGVKVPETATHICYIHHPPRNLYGYATGSTLQKYVLVRAYANFINFFLRQYDYKTAQRVNYFVANSEETARRVRKFYRRDSTVLYPPVSVPEKDAESSSPRSYYLSVGRLAWAKRIDVIIEAANALHMPLKIVGVGPEEARLKALAGPTVEFLGAVSDDALKTLYRNAKATIFCALDEDFGMVPVESMGFGTPVIALRQGGALETVLDGKTGLFFDEPTAASLQGTWKRFHTLRRSWYADCRKQALRFSVPRFVRAMKDFVRMHTLARP